jgi:hypothetical protein
LAANSNFLKQSTEEGFLAATLLYRLATADGFIFFFCGGGGGAGGC